MRWFRKALPLVKKLGEDATSKNFRATRGVLDVTNFNNAVLSSSGEHNVLLYTEAATRYKRGRKQNATFNGSAFYLHAALLLQKLRNVRSVACKTHPLRFDSFLLSKILQLETFLLPMKKCT